jgi:hypothetical protein
LHRVASCDDHHSSRGELANTPSNFLLIALALFVAWGRHTKAALSSP